MLLTLHVCGYITSNVVYLLTTQELIKLHYID